MIVLTRHVNGKMAVSREAPMADVTRKTHVSPPLMHAFRAAHEAKDATSKIDLRTTDGDRVPRASDRMDMPS